MNIKTAINKQKTLARKSLAQCKLLKNSETISTSKTMCNEKDFLKHDFKSIVSLEDLMTVVHSIRHNNLNKAGKYTRCKMCKEIMANLEPIDILPKFGNLMSILEQEVVTEKSYVEGKRMPSQNDLTRWALKDAVLAYYQGLSVPPEKVIVENKMDDRLITELAPDFDVIYKIWLEKLDELKRRGDKYTLNEVEMDKAREDMTENMRGSSFEKQLDRYRIDFMSKLPK